MDLNNYCFLVNQTDEEFIGDCGGIQGGLNESLESEIIWNKFSGGFGKKLELESIKCIELDENTIITDFLKISPLGILFSKRVFDLINSKISIHEEVIKVFFNHHGTEFVFYYIRFIDFPQKHIEFKSTEFAVCSILEPNLIKHVGTFSSEEQMVEFYKSKLRSFEYLSPIGKYTFENNYDLPWVFKFGFIDDRIFIHKSLCEKFVSLNFTGAEFVPIGYFG